MKSRVLVGAAAKTAAPPLMRLARRRRPFGDVFARFGREGAPPIELLSNYRASVKASWPHNWWPVTALLELRRRVELSPDLLELVSAIENGRTLPVPVAEFVDIVAELSRTHPAHLSLTDEDDDQFGVQIVEPLPVERELAVRAAGYRALAAQIRATAQRHELNFSRLRILDVGAGSGYLGFALAGLGAAEVVGVDLDPVSYVLPRERARMLELLAGGFGDRVQLVRGDVHALEFPDERFDLVCSMTAIEHFANLERAVAESRRVLRPDGIIYHGVEPWFSKRGGHGLCTFDFPWGHVRLRPEDVKRYLSEYRPYEAADAVEYYTHGFQTPRLTLAESQRIFATMFRVLEWRELQLSAFDIHRVVLTSAVLRDCRRYFPAVTKRDLVTATYTVVARR